MIKSLQWIVTIILALAIVPSFTSFSTKLFLAFPRLSLFSGPLNFLKLGAPFLFVFLWINRKEIPRKLSLILLGCLAIGTVATLIASGRCGFPPLVLREWFVTVLGASAACCLLLLPRRFFRVVLGSWLIIVYGSALLDASFPHTVDWLYSNIFDPDTRYYDVMEVGRRALTGIFGRQSMAKFLAWIPWLAAIFIASSRSSFIKSKTNVTLIVLLTIGSFASIMATSQRGPFLAALAGAVAFIVHAAVQLGKKKVAWYGAVGIVLAIGLSLVVVPRSIYEPRFKSLFGLAAPMKPDYWPPETVAEVNKQVRIKMTLFSAKVIAQNPLGHACIPLKDFVANGIYPPGHAHNMFLEQFRTRGWIWGATHLVLVLFGLLSAWKRKDFLGTAATAAMATIVFGGIFDHPWFVLNQSVVLATIIIFSLRLSMPFREPSIPDDDNRLL